MAEELVDLSLFDISPTNDQHLTVSEVPSRRIIPHAFTWPAESTGSYRRVPAFATMKPLPPLPRRKFCEYRPDPRREHGSARCILSRMKRIRAASQPERCSYNFPLASESPHQERSAYYTNTLQQRRNAATAPQLTLSAPHAHRDHSQPASPMIWMPNEQMWFVTEGGNPDAYLSAPFTADAAYVPPPYSRCEPSRDQRSLDSSPNAGQDTRSTNSRQGEDRLSPLFQEAINGVSMYEYGDPSEPPTFQVERDWRSVTSAQTSRRDSWYSALSERSPASPDLAAARMPTLWDGKAIEIRRPSSAR